jgi:hypothetical protein
MIYEFIFNTFFMEIPATALEFAFAAALAAAIVRKPYLFIKAIAGHKKWVAVVNPSFLAVSHTFLVAVIHKPLKAFTVASYKVPNTLNYWRLNYMVVMFSSP